jgi:hypothetical protein
MLAPRRVNQSRLDRRAALTRLGTAGIGVGVSPVLLRAQRGPLAVGGRAVEIAVSSVSRSTVRIQVLPIGGTRPPDDGVFDGTSLEVRL